MISILGMFLIIAPLLAGLIVFLVLFLNRTKKNENNNLIYEDEMGEQELKDLDDEIY
tara:strand:- start:1708 stop:1878 length:171 start_codon:yes stop_codon:yes gene_type:complete